MKIRLAWTCLAAVCLIAVPAGAPQDAADGGSPFSGAVADERSPTAPGSAQPYLAVDRAGRVWLSWLEARAEGGHRFRLAALQGTTWSDPVTVAEGGTLLANWADVPAIYVTSTDTLAVSWLERGPSRASYFIRLRTSADQGRTWTPTVTPHRDESATEHGFVSFFEGPASDLGLVWLDGREMAGHAAGLGTMTLRATTVSGGKPGPELVVDPRVCECCPTSAARIDGGAIVAYRDRSDHEVRDIAVARFLNGAWTAPRIVHADNWEINACPVNGPAVTASGRFVAVAWFTMAGGTPRTKVAFSADGGETFSEPIGVNAGVTYGRLGVAFADADRVLVSSVERTEAGAHLVVREVRRNGRTGDLVRIATAGADRSGGFPRMAVTGRRVVFAWTQVRPGEPPQVRVAGARLK